MEELEALIEMATGEPPICSDLDNECVDVKSKVRCWLYSPECGYCPFLAGDSNG